MHTTEKILAVCSILGSQPGQCMQHSTELRAPTLKKIYSLCNPLLRQSQRCATHCRVDLGGLQHTAEMISAMCNTPQKQSQRCATYILRKQTAHREVKSKSLVALTLIKGACQPLPNEGHVGDFSPTETALLEKILHCPA